MRTSYLEVEIQIAKWTALARSRHGAKYNSSLLLVLAWQLGPLSGMVKLAGSAAALSEKLCLRQTGETQLLFTAAKSMLETEDSLAMKTEEETQIAAALPKETKVEGRRHTNGGRNLDR
nr:hypothetical protein Iba_chr05cCG9880 [Ipomoea batatas]